MGAASSRREGREVLARESSSLSVVLSLQELRSVPRGASVSYNGQDRRTRSGKLMPRR